MRKFFLVLLVITAVLFFAQTPKKGGTLVVAHWSDPISFNPCAKIDDAGNGIYPSIFSKLVALDHNYNVIPDLAESWEISKDGLTYTFHLRKALNGTMGSRSLRLMSCGRSRRSRITRRLLPPNTLKKLCLSKHPTITQWSSNVRTSGTVPGVPGVVRNFHHAKAHLRYYERR